MYDRSQDTTDSPSSPADHSDRDRLEDVRARLCGYRNASHFLELADATPDAPWVGDDYKAIYMGELRDSDIGDGTPLEVAMSQLFAALLPYDRAEQRILAVTSAWADLSFDDRRYIDRSFPRLADALIKLEDHII